MFDDQPARDTTFLYELARDSETQKLISYLRQSDKPEIRRRTAEVLGDLADVSTHDDDEDAVRALVYTVTEDDDESVRARAIDALYRYGQPALDHLIDEMANFDTEEAPDWVTSRTVIGWLDADYPEFRMVAAAALGRMGDETAVPHLLDALDDSAPRVRERAARSCGRIGDSRCVPALADRLDDRNPIVQQAAANALGSIGSQPALEPLIPLARADNEELRRIAVDELGQFGSFKPIVVLLKTLEDDSESIQRTALVSLIQLFVDAPPDRSKTVRGTVAEQLQRIDTAAVVPPLLDVMSESQRWEIRRNATWLLGTVADPDSDTRDDVYDCLIDALDDEDEQTAKLAAASLASLDSDELERRLHIYVQDEQGSDEAVDLASGVLEEIGSSLSKELVTNSVDYTYVRDPADYTERKRTQHDDSEEQ